MGIAKPPPSIVCSSSSKKTITVTNTATTTPTATTSTATPPLHLHPIIIRNSMSQEYHHQGANIFTTFANGFGRSNGLTQTNVSPNPVEDPGQELYAHQVYEPGGGMLSEMFEFSHGPSPGHEPGQEFLDYRRAVGGLGPPTEWYGTNREVPRQDAMQLFLTNPPQKSPSPPPQHGVGGGGFHPLDPSTNNNSTTSTITHLNFWNPGELTGVIEGQGSSLSLSLSSLEVAPSNGQFFKNLTQGSHPLQPMGSFIGPSSGQNPVHLGYRSTATSSLGVVNVLRISKYTKPAQELLDEFCSVGRGQIKKNKLGRQNSSTQNPTSSGGGDGGSGGEASSSIKDPPQLTPADRIEHQRRKVKLVAMLDEVDRKYNNYCEQMQIVVNSFDLILGCGSAIPYTALAQKAMSRHFRCLKDAIHLQLKHSCEMLGEKDPTTSCGITKGETPRLKVLEQSLRQQRAFHQMGMMDQEAWRPQRGLPERSVNILRAWLFEHFLHPYPSDADKHLLARQTGLSRNQVSNWFINARVRLWKPMIEEMYQQEAKELEEERDREANQQSSNTSNNFQTTQQHQQYGQQSGDSMSVEGSQPDHDPVINPHLPLSPSQPLHRATGVGLLQASGSQDFNLQGPEDTYHFDGDNVSPTTMIRFGTTSGDVSLTLGLRHAGNTPEKGVAFSIRDFNGS